MNCIKATLIRMKTKCAIIKNVVKKNHTDRFMYSFHVTKDEKNDHPASYSVQVSIDQLLVSCVSFLSRTCWEWPVPCVRVRRRIWLTIHDIITIVFLWWFVTLNLKSKWRAVFTWHYEHVSGGHSWSNFICDFCWIKGVAQIYYISLLLHLFLGTNIF